MARAKKDAATAIDRIRDVVKLAAEEDDIAHKRFENGHAVTRGSQGLTPMGRKKLEATLEPGGTRYHIIEGAKTCTDRVQRIEYITNLMSLGAWYAPMTFALAKAWGCSPSNVLSMNAEASRSVRRAIGNKDTVKTNLLAFIDAIARDAFDNGDRRNALAGARLFAEIAGVNNQKVHHEVTGANGGPIQLQALQKLTDDELDRRIMAEAARVAEEGKIAQLPSHVRDALTDVVKNPISDAEWQEVGDRSDEKPPV